MMSLRDRVRAGHLHDRLVRAVYPATIVAVNLASGNWHWVVIANLASARDARMQGETLRGSFGVSDYWVRKD